MTLIRIAIDVILIQPPLMYAMSAVLHCFSFFRAIEIEFKLLIGKDITDCNILFNSIDYFSLSSSSELGSKHNKNNFLYYI